MREAVGERIVLVDASVFITLSEVDALELIRKVHGKVSMPGLVVDEIDSEPAASKLDDALFDWIGTSTLVKPKGLNDEWDDHLNRAANHLGSSQDPSDWGGDVPLLASGLYHDNVVLVTDDKPLRNTCKTLSIPVSGSIGVLVRAVERGDFETAIATEKLYAMDEVGARLSASLVRKAERLIEEAAEE